MPSLSEEKDAASASLRLIYFRTKNKKWYGLASPFCEATRRSGYAYREMN